MARYNVSNTVVNNKIDTLVGTEPLMYARACRIKCTGENMIPMSFVDVYVNGEKYNHRCEGRDWVVGSGNSASYLKPGAKFRTNQAGKVDFMLDLEGGRFKTGDIEITVTNGELGSTSTSTLTSLFHSEGTLQVFTRVNSTLDITRISRPWDPVGQGFFTFGTSGPIYISSIDLFFASRDETIPVQLQIRKVTAGYPDIEFVSPDAVVDLPASSVQTTGDEDGFSKPTTFRFAKPILLEADQQYCFVVQSNSNAYNLYTARMGQESFETKKVIFEQPYIGTMFKSANNFTWVVSQNETLKFRINKAVFDVNKAPRAYLGGNTPSRMLAGTNFFTTTGSDKIKIKFFDLHGYTGQNTLEQITIRPNIAVWPGRDTDPATQNRGNFNGFTLGQISGDFKINRVIDPYTIEIKSNGGIASKTGPVISSGMVNFISAKNIDVDSAVHHYPTSANFPVPPGSNSAPLKIRLNNPSQAERYTQEEMDAAPFSRFEILDPGDGYTESDRFRIETSAGPISENYILGLQAKGGQIELTAHTAAHFIIDMVRPVSLFTANLDVQMPAGCSVEMNHSFVDVTGARTPKIPTILGTANYAPDGALVVNNITADGMNQDMKSFQIELNFKSDNKNVGPVFDFSGGASVDIFTNIINDQGFSENVVTGAVPSSGLVSVEVTDGGYYPNGTPSITVVPAEDETNTINIVPAVVTPVLSNGAIISVTVNTAGSGYTRPPSFVISQPPFGGSQATLSSIIDKINSELLPANGNALSRYITKQIKLAAPSTGIRLRSNIASTPDTTVDWYIKTSLGDSTEEFDNLPWTLLQCDTKRNKSLNISEMYEYEFYAEDLPDFVTYKLKAVLSSKRLNVTPYVKDFKVIVTA